MQLEVQTILPLITSCCSFCAYSTNVELHDYIIDSGTPGAAGRSKFIHFIHYLKAPIEKFIGRAKK